MVNQLHGTHRIGGETKELIPGGLLNWMPELAELTWFYSASTAAIDIPNQVSVDVQTQTDPETGDVLQSRIKTSSSAARFRFTDLDDEIVNYGWKAMLPIETHWSLIEISGGYQHEHKARTYAQSQFGIGPLSVSDPATLHGDLDEVFSDRNITDTSNDFVFSLLGSGTRSHIAATMTQAMFGKLDWTWNDMIRLAGGVRWRTTNRWPCRGTAMAMPSTTRRYPRNRTCSGRVLSTTTASTRRHRSCTSAVGWPRSFRSAWATARPRYCPICARSPTRAISIPSPTKS